MERRLLPTAVSSLIAPAALWCLGVTLLWTFRAADPDLFARVAAGRIVSLTGWVAPEDPFSFTARPGLWIDHEWLSGFFFYELSQLGGDQALWWFKWSLYGAFILGVWFAESRPRSPALTFTVLSGTLYLWAANVRSQIFTYALFSILLCILGRAPRPWRNAKLLLLPALFAAWANLHGGVVLGCFALGVFALFRAIRSFRTEIPLLAVTAVSLAATAVNPWGFLYWGYLRDALTMPRPHITEWQTVSPFSPVGVIIIVSLIGVILGRRGRERSVADELFRFAMLAVSAAIAFRSLRLCGCYFTVLAAYFIPELSAALKQSLAFGGRCTIALEKIFDVCTVAVGAGAFIALGVLAFRTPSFDFSPYPEAAVERLWESGHEGRLLVGFNEGSYALWRLYPRFTVSLDGRYEEVYDSKTVEAVRCALDSRCESGNEEFSKLDPDFVLTRSERTPLWISGSYTRLLVADGFELFSRPGMKPAREPGRHRPMWQAGFDSIVNSRGVKSS